MEAAIRSAAATDREAILDLMREFNSEEGYPFEREGWGEKLDLFLSNAELGRMIVAQSGGEIVGYAVLAFGFSFEFRGRDAFVDELFVAPNCRDRKIGRHLMEHALGEAKSLGIRAVHLECERWNTRAAKFHESMGFADNERYLLTNWIAPKD